ncbi:hypothetical protein N7478_000564 [Penicillium angulare]|uniref:uncharacterized protein n=1 Tax=Penicillium angulare TaxID=116970 RepID=UPI0025412F54|nr:uncharacterized protein N7478_000564 [Penicillium angulare]KAJ5291313.1 hypothetical protein N7478_000564 [Penicillium angulare]
MSKLKKRPTQCDHATTGCGQPNSYRSSCSSSSSSNGWNTRCPHQQCGSQPFHALLKALYDINVWGPLRVTKAFVPFLILAKGSIVFVTSISGYLNVSFMGSYAGSKRAMELMADTLRLELVSFNVKVLCVVTGAVRTLGQTYFGDLKLPEDSLYKPIEETVVSRAQGHYGAERMPLMEYSSQVFAQIEQGATGRFWCGKNSDSTKARISGESHDTMVSGYS